MANKPRTDNAPVPERANILLVDDQAANLLALRAVLDDLGHNLVEVHSGKEALRQLADDDYAVILLDVQMHGLDGFETARLIRSQEKTRHTPIIFLTAYDTDRLVIEQAYALGAVDFLVKPLVPVVLKAKIAGFVDLFQKTEQVRRQAEELRQVERQRFDERLAEENARLRESEEKFRLLADTIPQLAWMARPDGYIFWYNRRWYEYTGTTPEQMEGWGWQSVHDPVELPKVLERWKASIATGQPFDMVFPLKGADGLFHPFLTRINPLRNEAERILYWFGTNTDISEQKRVEHALRESERSLHKQSERLRLLWEAASVLLTTNEPDAMLRGLFAKIAPHLGLDTYFNFMVNEAGDALRLESCAGIPEETAKSIRRLEFGQAICGTVAVQRKPLVATFIQQSDDPKVQLVKSLGIRAYACNPLIAEGMLFGTLSFASRTRDEFDADELEFLRTLNHYVTVAYERLRLIKELKEASHRKDEFLMMLAHELRNPLAPVRNALEVLKLSSSDRLAADKARAVMERQVTHFSRLVDGLLDVSRLISNKVVLQTERLDFARLVRVAAEDQLPAFEEANLALVVETPELPVWVTGDPTRLTQVIDNLLNNARKFTDPGGRVQIRVHPSSQLGQAVLTVSDTGIGIEPEMLPHLFETFAQGDRSLDRTRGGLGLGLSVVRGLVELHGGQVQAASAGPGRGAEFTVRLPAEPEPAALTQMPTASGRNEKHQRILVVEDNRDSAECLRMLLELYGYEVTVAYSGPEGVKAAEQCKPNIILCDIGLPGLDGYEVVRTLRRNPTTANAHMIAVTGYGSDDDRSRSRDAGFDRHMVKPVDPVDLRQALASLG